jgi:hypothetical protein
MWDMGCSYYDFHLTDEGTEAHTGASSTHCSLLFWDGGKFEQESILWGEHFAVAFCWGDIGNSEEAESCILKAGSSLQT